MEKLFHEFNKKYFNGELPDHKIVLVERIEGGPSWIPKGTKLGGAYRHENRTIEILSTQSQEEKERSLIHEMAHFYGWGHWGGWRDGMLATGLEWAKDQALYIYPGSWNKFCRLLRIKILGITAIGLASNDIPSFESACEYLEIPWESERVRKSLWWLHLSWHKSLRLVIREIKRMITELSDGDELREKLIDMLNSIE